MTIQEMNAIQGIQLARTFKETSDFYTQEDMKDIADHIRRKIDVPALCKEAMKQDWTLHMVAALACTDDEYSSDDDIQLTVAIMYKTMQQRQA